MTANRAFSLQQDNRSPDDVQREASHPTASVWVGASAGTGKTKVLTDRLLRLLLPRADGTPGAEPHRILCLTFTKAAASEMAIRLFDTLGRWAVMPVDRSASDAADTATLRKTLARLTGEEPSAQQIEAAQQLFARVLDAPAGLRILTIHSFCQSVLGRFPLEADLQPHFKVLEEGQAGELVVQAQQMAIARAAEPGMAGSALANALDHLTAEQSEDQFTLLAADICGERSQLASLLRRFNDVESIYADICAFYGIRPGQDDRDYLAAAVIPTPDDEAEIKRAALALAEGSMRERERGERILSWLSLSGRERILDFDTYRRGFLNAEGEIYGSSFPGADTKKKYPDCEAILHAEGRRIQGIIDTCKAVKSARLTRDVLVLGAAVNEAYQALKAERGGVDYDDLILKTFALLNGRTLKLEGLGDGAARDVTSWIMYKLDQGIDHVLVDEAQDTNPEQWAIIQALCDDFFSGTGGRDERGRTVFAVGDMKQSIYSFQRAAPEEFLHMSRHFKQRAEAAGLDFRPVHLSMSFRSTQAVLETVDKVFDRDDLRFAMGGEVVHHSSVRKGQGGLVELWPVIETERTEQRDFWDPPVSVHEARKSVFVLADMVAARIEGWIKGGEVLPAYDRTVRPGDIMILVRSRTALVDAMIRALKLRGIPVSGVDRMDLSEQLVVQDLLAAAKFCLLPPDDLTLACLLKSPLIGWGDAELFALAAGRPGDLWSALVHYQPTEGHRLLDDPEGLAQDKARAAAGYLRGMRAAAQRQGTYEFFSHILLSPCPGDAQGGLRAIRRRLGEDALDPLEEFLRLALGFGRDRPDMLELFVQHFESNPVEIKREMEEAAGQVRIMTVHGSKGLQAPIVILPDTIPSKTGRKSSGLLWPDKTDLDFPLWAPRKEDEPQAYQAVKQRLDDKAAQEDQRLLYVAMTRAADRLYVCGRKPARGDGGYEVSWYKTIRAGLSQLSGVQALADGTLRYEIAQEGAPDKARDAARTETDAFAAPEWLRRAPPEDLVPPRPLIPSRQLAGDEAGGADLVALSPLESGTTYRFLRGHLTHKLLQFLPQFPVDRRERAAVQFTDRNGRGLPEEVRESVVREVLAILNHPEYRLFFAETGLSEVPVTALLDNNLALSGQIDRLAIGADRIWILDYKTNRPPPERAEDVSPAYIRQMRAYRDAISKVYPGRVVTCALLWTDGPRLMILPESILNLA